MRQSDILMAGQPCMYGPDLWVSVACQVMVKALPHLYFIAQQDVRGQMQLIHADEGAKTPHWSMSSGQLIAAIRLQGPVPAVEWRLQHGWHPLPCAKTPVRT